MCFWGRYLHVSFSLEEAHKSLGDLFPLKPLHALLYISRVIPRSVAGLSSVAAASLWGSVRFLRFAFVLPSGVGEEPRGGFPAVTQQDGH